MSAQHTDRNGRSRTTRLSLPSRWSLTAEVTATPPHGDALRLTATADCSEVEASDLRLSLNW